VLLRPSSAPAPRLPLLALLICLAWSAPSARALGPLAPDEQLARASAAAVRGTVIGVAARTDTAVGAIYTHVHVAVSRAWGFATPPAVVELKVLGGSVGVETFAIGGQAQFTTGEEIFAFLDVRPRDGTLSVAGLERGAWTLPHGADRHLATRQRHVEPPYAPDISTLARLEALAAHAGTAVRLPAGAGLPSSLPPTMLTGNDMPAAAGGRWHDADWGAPVYVDSMASGHPLFPDRGFGQLLRALATWSAPRALQLAPGVLRGPRCFGTSGAADLRISVSYDDPCDEIADSSPTLALGGAFFTTADIRFVRGVPFGRIVKGIVVLDNVAGKFAGMSTGCYEDVLTHELGHAAGLAHTSAVPSMMAPSLAADCVHRLEAQPLQPADLSALDAIYPIVPTGDGPPGVPGGLTADVAGSTVTVRWLPTGAAAASYRLIVGSMPGASDVAQFVLGSPGVVAPAVARGVYYVRVVAMNAHGTSLPSAEVAVVVGDGLPGIPSALMAAAGQRGDVRVFWQAPASGASPSSYALLVGTEADRPTVRIPLGSTSLAAEGVATGTYYVRVVAVNGAGAGPASPEILVVVP